MVEAFRCACRLFHIISLYDEEHSLSAKRGGDEQYSLEGYQ